MKALWLGMALAVSVSLSQPVWAADKMKLGLRGYFGASTSLTAADLAAADANDAALRHGYAKQIEISTESQTPVDGLSIGLKAKLDNRTSAESARDGDAGDELFIWAAGSLGEVQIGEVAGASTQMTYGAPYVTTDIRANHSELYVPSLRPINLRNLTGSSLSNDDLKFVYLTPRIKGVQLGVSYMADGKVDRPDLDETLKRLSEADQKRLSEILEVGLNFSQRFDEIELGLSGAYVDGALGKIASLDSDEEFRQWALGGQVGYGGLSVAGSFKETSFLSFGSILPTAYEAKTWDVGASYRAGPWSIGAAYLSSSTNALNKGENNDGDALEVAGGYSFGSVFHVNAGVQFWQFENDGAKLVTVPGPVTAAEEDGAVVFLETGLSF
jgi:predicted porin